MFNLSCNPFEQQATYDFDDYVQQPFILDGLETPNHLKTKIKWNFSSRDRILIKIIALKGYGKSTISFFLQDAIKEEENKDILYFYTNRVDTDYHMLLRDLIHEFNIETTKEENNEDVVKKFLGDKKIYLFIDFQDIIETKSLKILSNTLEKLPLLSKTISIILTMNKSHAIKMESISYVLGKYTSFELSPFSLVLTKKLIEERLDKARINKVDNTLFPFNEEIINLIHGHSGGIPRNILSACDLILTSSDGKNIEEDEVPLTLRNEFAKKVIWDMTVEGNERDYLTDLYNTIKVDFSGEIFKEKDLHDKLNEKFGWAMKSSRKRIRILNKIGLITITKGENLWSNTIRII